MVNRTEREYQFPEHLRVGNKKPEGFPDLGLKRDGKHSNEKNEHDRENKDKKRTSSNFAIIFFWSDSGRDAIGSMMSASSCRGESKGLLRLKSRVLKHTAHQPPESLLVQRASA